MAESEVENCLVDVPPPPMASCTTTSCSADTEEVTYGTRALADGTPWTEKTLVVLLRRPSHVKPVVLAGVLCALVIVAVVLISNTLFSRPDRVQISTAVSSSDSETPDAGASESVRLVHECGTRPAFPKRRMKRIVNGAQSSEGQWPWQVVVRHKEGYRCGGVVIDTDLILTAAHCMYRSYNWKRLNASDFSVLSGITVRNHTEDTNVQIAQVQTFYVHPNYLSERRISNFDLALLKLAAPLRWTSTVIPACLPDDGVRFGSRDKCFLASWGSIKPRLVLQMEQSFIEMPLLSTDDCIDVATAISDRHLLQINPQKFCAGIVPTAGSQRRGACQFDSGSGLVCLNQDTQHGIMDSWYVVGIVSGGRRCGEVNYFSNVTAMTDFIKPLVDGHNPKQFFDCADGGGTIWADQECDGLFDCDDRSDEVKCVCSERHFRCDNGLCKLEYYYRCDGVDDCGDGSDENNCTYYDCGDDGRVIAPHMLCDGEMDCNDGRDEAGCECSPNQYRCDNSLCVPTFWRCDGYDDCLDASDETNCSCTDSQLDCGNSRCVPFILLCDAYDDCGNFKDEDNCTCVPDYMQCDYLGLCLPNDLAWMCKSKYHMEKFNNNNTSV